MHIHAFMKKPTLTASYSGNSICSFTLFLHLTCGIFFCMKRDYKITRWNASFALHQLASHFSTNIIDTTHKILIQLKLLYYVSPDVYVSSR